MRVEETKKRSKFFLQPRILLETVIGFCYLALGVALIFAEQLGFHFTLGTSFLRLFGGVVALYGIFRVLRGIRQLFFMNKGI
jgi:hypothetical protein